MEYAQGHLDTVMNDSFAWTDIRNPTRNNMKILEQNYHFHELDIEDCLSKIQLPKVDKYEDYVFIILHFPAIQKDKSIFKFSQLSIFIGPNYLVTVHQGDLKPLLEMFELCKQSNTQRQALMGKSPGYLLHSLIDSLVDDLLHILMKIMGNLDDIEDVVFDDTKSDAKEISFLRREITALRRIVIPLRRTVLKMIKDIQKFSEDDLSPYFANVEDHIDKVLETLDEAKETIEIYKDTDYMLSTERSNKILAVLTILFTLSLPATVLSTIYGMNINLPGSLAQPWIFLGPYTTLIILVVASVISTLVMLWYFSRLGWVRMYD
jgi:magnesium transporter